MPALHSPKPAVVPTRGMMTDNEQDVLRFAMDSAGAVVLVTLVEVRGGAARATGAQMAVREDGLFCGHISGGCVEAAVAAEALATLGSGTDRFLKIGEGSPFFDILLPCGGGLTLSLHSVTDRRPIADTLTSLARRRAAGLGYDPATQTLAPSTHMETGWRDGVFHRHYRPARRIALAGQGIEAEVLRKVARAAGYDVVALAAENLDAETAAVILMHDPEAELSLLETALAGPSRYIGILGSKTTHQRRCTNLRSRGHGESDIARVKGPIGFFGPTRDASTLALSILADIAQ